MLDNIVVARVKKIWVGSAYNFQRTNKHHQKGPEHQTDRASDRTTDRQGIIQQTDRAPDSATDRASDRTTYRQGTVINCVLRCLTVPLEHPACLPQGRSELGA